MKKLLILIFFAVTSAVAFAQSEITSDTLRFTPANREAFGGFILDIDMPSIVPSLPKINDYTLLGPDATKNYSELFYPSRKQTFGLEGISGAFHPVMGYGGWGAFSHSRQLQTAVFRLNDRLQLKTYGQYKADGSRMPDNAVFPWQKNNFIGGMELKMNNNFGIRIEVQRGAGNGMYPYYP